LCAGSAFSLRAFEKGLSKAYIMQINTLGAETAASPITVALNWQAGLKKYFPGAA
jgi:hypothetical protein